MIYYKDDNCIIRNLEMTDVHEIVEEEIAQGWLASDEKYLNHLKNQEEGRCISLVAVYEGKAVGYINVYTDVQTGPFAGSGYSEIKDFGVIEKCRRHGIGSRLMDVAEKIGFQYSETVSIGVGLHSGYGSAQRMYVKRGYLPDGSGVWYQDIVCEPYDNCCNDDDLVLYFSKTKTVNNQ